MVNNKVNNKANNKTNNQPNKHHPINQTSNQPAVEHVMKNQEPTQKEIKSNSSDAIAIYEEERTVDKQSIQQAEKIRNSIYGDNGERYLLSFNSVHLIALDGFCNRMFSTSKLPYQIYGTKGRERVRALGMAHDIKLLPAYARIYSPSLSFPPDFDLFFKTYRKHEISRHFFVTWETEEIDSWSEKTHTEITPELAEMANDFVETLREMARKVRLKSRMSDWRSGCRHNKEYLQDFMIRMLDQHSRIMVVDLVFLYRKAACKNSDEAIERSLEQQELAEREYLSHFQNVDYLEKPGDNTSRKVSLEELKEDLKHFFNNMRNKRTLFAKDKFIDYFGRIEYSQDAGYHVHICFFYKGSEAQRDIFYSHEIGKYWIKITEGRGYYHSCNAKAAQGKYKNVGIGMVEHDDFEKIRHLWKAVVYFVKASQVVRVKRTDKEQMVLHGKKKERPGERLGRPRGEGLSGPAYRSKLEKIFV